MSYSGKAFMVSMQPAEIRKEIARALDQKSDATLQVIGDGGATEIKFSISTTNHTPEDRTLDLVLGITEDGETVQVTIPTTGTPTMAVRPSTTTQE